MLRNTELRRLAREGRVGFITINSLAHYRKCAGDEQARRSRVAGNLCMWCCLPRRSPTHLPRGKTVRIYDLQITS
jgi:hypothetical protein